MIKQFEDNPLGNAGVKELVLGLKRNTVLKELDARSKKKRIVFVMNDEDERYIYYIDM